MLPGNISGLWARRHIKTHDDPFCYTCNVSMMEDQGRAVMMVDMKIDRSALKSKGMIQVLGMSAVENIKNQLSLKV